MDITADAGRGAAVPLAAASAEAPRAPGVIPERADPARAPVRGGVISLFAQACKFVLQMGSVAILARILLPADFGLQGMVVTITSVIGLFSDIGLGAATIQRDVITHAQLSTVFWINLAVGALLAALTALLAPALALFYHEPRLVTLTIVSSVAFLVGGATAQHMALLQRGMFYTRMAVIEIVTVTSTAAIGIGMALAGFGYWSLVGASVGGPIVRGIVLWFSVPWRPGWPSRQSGTRSMLHFGGTITLNNVVVYISYNLEKIMLGRFAGAEVLGLYGRAYQLVNLPLEQLHTSMYKVAFPALSRLQTERDRLCRAFLRGYSVLLSLTVPVTLISALFAPDIVRTLLGPKWNDSVLLLRLLTPSIFVFALINPFGWFMQATGKAARSLYIAYMIAPILILGILAGIRHGAEGVATGYSCAMCLLAVPVVVWARHDSGISMRDYWATLRQPLLSGLAAGVAGLGAAFLLASWPSLPRLIVGSAVVVAMYGFFLLAVMGQKALYQDLARQVLRREKRAD